MSGGGNVTDLLLGTGRNGDVAVVDATGAHTYAELRGRVSALMRQVENWALPSGSRIGLLGPNTVHWVAGYLAVMRAGHTVVPFMTGLRPDEVLERALRVGAVAVLVDPALHSAFAPTLGDLEQPLDTDPAPLSSTSSPLRAAPPAPEAALLFTSGSTARPRAVRVGHDNIEANTASIVRYLDLARDDRMFAVLPLAYCFGASLLHTHLAVGGSVRLATSLAFPAAVVQSIAEDGCTGFAGVPSTYQLLLRASTFGSEPIPGLRHLQQAGGRLDPAHVAQVRAGQPAARLFLMYGQTEATSRLSYLPPDQLDVRPGSIGRGIPGVILRVTDGEGNDVPPGEIGEIRARGDNVTHGYWDEPEATATRFVDGELRTGDLARVDDEGYIHIVDRAEDFLKPWGHRVSSVEVEQVALALPGVSAAAVVGRPDDAAGEAVVLFCMVTDGPAPDPDAIRRHLRTRLAKHAQPHEVHIVPDLPLTPNGKIAKAALREAARTLTPPGRP